MEPIMQPWMFMEEHQNGVAKPGGGIYAEQNAMMERDQIGRQKRAEEVRKAASLNGGRETRQIRAEHLKRLDRIRKIVRLQSSFRKKRCGFRRSAVTEEPAALKQLFLETDFSTDALEPDYVLKNMEECLKKIEIYMRFGRHFRKSISEFEGETLYRLSERLKEANWYTDLVRSALRENGVTLDFGEISVHDAAFDERWHEYEAIDILRYYLSERRFDPRSRNIALTLENVRRTKAGRHISGVLAAEINHNIVEKMDLPETLSGEHNGYLEVPSDGTRISEGDENIHCGEQYEYKDCTDMPLFPHWPCLRDIEQGKLGDCYLLAGLISVVNQSPMEIMKIMKDNGDGTVTVRFMPGEPAENERMVFKPCYVTVKKTIPVIRRGGADAFAQKALWVKMMEKAYVASGIHLLSRINQNLSRKREPLRKYEDFLEFLKGDGKKPNMRLDYKDIEGGLAGEFVSLLLGNERRIYYSGANIAGDKANEIASILPPAGRPEEYQQLAERFGYERYYSIVYEYMERKKRQVEDQSHAQEFFPAAEMSYEEEMDTLMRFCGRSCMIHLHIVYELTKVMKTDLLQMKNEDEIKNWYEDLKKIFTNYKKKDRSEDKGVRIIKMVQEYYSTDDFADCFSAITAEDFSNTVDILKERHLALFRKNQRGQQNAEAEEAGQIGGRKNEWEASDTVYTTEERNIYETIEQYLRQKKSVTFGTRVLAENRDGENGESVKGGLVGTHAYAILDTQRIRLNDKEYLFLGIQNPWGRTGVLHTISADGIRRSTKECIRGKFLMDIKTFMRVVSVWEAVPA